MHDNPDEFDLSNMSGWLQNNDNCQVLGKMKSEVGSKLITEFVGLSPKSYSYKYCCDKQCKKSKGVSLAVSDKTMDFDDYKRVMVNRNYQTRPIFNIKSFNQQIYTTVEDKVVLNAFYDKLQLLNDIDCIPFGFNPK
jgi:hypothetical protein